MLGVGTGVVRSRRVRILLDYRPALRNRTGVGEYAHQMAAALARQKGAQDTITLFSSSWKDRLATDVVPGAETLDARIPVSALNFAWHRLGWPDLELLGAHADTAWSMHPLLMPSRRAAQVVTIHDLFFLDRPEATVREIRRDYAALAADHARRADGVIVVSEYTRDQVVNRLAVPEDRITVCPNGAPAWTPRDEPAGIGPILHLGTVEPRKNVAALMRAYAALVKQYPAAPDLVLAGRIDELPELTASDDRTLVGTRIQTPGYVTDAERMRLYRDASMVVIASADEGFGLPAVEAMTLGVPVVAADRGALREVVGEAGVLVDADDSGTFAGAMRRLLEDGAVRRDLAARGIARSRMFNWDRSAAKAREALAAAVARRQGKHG